MNWMFLKKGLTFPPTPKFSDLKLMHQFALGFIRKFFNKFYFDQLKWNTNASITKLIPTVNSKFQ